ncbi:unnamed protein product [Rhizoctonia solani]|uniref:Uncharacterized protein n=1 Tax=Rhizoctonia solani TaxID=456999 RepID=A0A8H3A7H4_9AGAM|nr:unnamed protein product [Rhizoctonia solani]CAE6434264.1 unnamed protein product [Rhizoctonia solani]
MSFLDFFATSSSSFNPGLAWSLGSGGKGYLVIDFPFILDSGWYQEQSCTEFRTFQHRKEREGLRHEFIILKLLNGSVCRVERMGDPNARLNALATHGSVAHDIAQCFGSESEAHLESSELISETTLPCKYEIQDVLKICRAIKEGEKTRNYTLQVYNCYFFSIAIQACLTRFIAHWEDKECFEAWLLKVNEAIDELTKTDQVFSSPRSSPYHHPLFRLTSFISTCDNQEESAMFRSWLTAWSPSVQRDMEQRVNNLLWYSTIGSSLNEFIEEKATEAILAMLQERIAKALALTSGSLELPGLGDRDRLPFILTSIVARAGGFDWPKCPSKEHNYLKRKAVCQVAIIDAIRNLGGRTATKLDSRASACIDPAIDATNTPSDHYLAWLMSQVMVCTIAHLLWALHIVLLGVWGIRLFTEVEKISPVIVDEILDDMAAELEHSGTMVFADHNPKRVVQEVYALLANQRAVWNKSPWSSLYDLIKEHMDSQTSVLERLEELKPTIRVQFGEAKVESSISISNFQKHILRRIEIQAKEVESVWLGSSTKIQVELQETLSQVWRMIREDVDIVKKAENSSASAPSQYIPPISGVPEKLSAPLLTTSVPLMPPLLTLESLLLGGESVVPFAWPLKSFCTWALQKQELSEAPVRAVLCNRQGVHQFILLSCDVNMAHGVVGLWFRIERHPGNQGVGVLLNKSKQAVDTLKASTNLQALCEPPYDVRDSFTYSPHDNPGKVLKFKHIAEMCQYFIGHPREYSLLGANCRWICYALLECLREARLCYGGTWLPSRDERPTADVRAAQLAKSHYLKDKHPTCCGSQYLAHPNFGAHMARATTGLASIAAVSSDQTTRNGGSRNEASPEVIIRTPRSLLKSAIPHHQPSISTTSTNPQPPPTSGALPNSTNTYNVVESSPGLGDIQLTRQKNDISPPPVGGNSTQHLQSPPISEDMSNNSRPHYIPGLALRPSSMNIQPDVPVAGANHGQWLSENATIPREPPSSGHNSNTLEKYQGIDLSMYEPLLPN